MDLAVVEAITTPQLSFNDLLLVAKGAFNNLRSIAKTL
jgi:hypothetical protein